MNGGLRIGGAPKGYKCGCDNNKYKCKSPNVKGLGYEGGKYNPRCTESRIVHKKSSYAQCLAAEANPWIQHVRDFAEANGMTYAQALSDPDVTRGYKKKTKSSKGVYQRYAKEHPYAK